ncbi:proline-rich protein PRCC [Aplysia californica]|uniref:Proline-rich protein PRCC n=1 Tax=Aplysia californica TaxID=6500 RepID=A0ABM0JP58_APLCA|nr:proline-rich protein PRCC [Aplysia californica]
MSLVAYGASDNSDSENEEQQEEPASQSRQSENNNRNVRSSGVISDEDEYESVSSTSVAAFSNSKKSLGSDSLMGAVSVSSAFENQVNSTSVTSLDDLPAPQVRPTLNADADTVEDDLEEEVKPKAAEIASAPKPPGKKRQPVKITIPSLDETPEEVKSESKRPVSSSTTKNGLFSLLPAPMHSAKKEINRPLIPHSLTKKPAAASKTSSTTASSKKTTTGTHTNSRSEVASSSDGSSKRMSQFNALTGYDSDSDEDNEDGSSSSNFFSLNSSAQKNSKDSIATSLSSSSSRLQSEEVSSSKSDSNLGAGNSKTSGQTLVTDVKDSEENVPEGSSKEGGDEEEEEAEPEPEPGSVNDAPLDFGSVNRLNAWSGSSYGFLNPVGLSGPVVPSFQTQQAMPSNSLYNLANAESAQSAIDDESDEVPGDDLKQFMSDKEFQRFQGKRKRGMEESISFVDAKVDDYVDPSEVSKHLTEETEYVSNKNKDNMPTSQQKRKKQITYLAYQAKEKELELKNTWAQNKMTKKQTQSKYGF